MSSPATSPTSRADADGVLPRLERSGRAEGGDDALLTRLRDLQSLVAADLSDVEAALAVRRGDATPAWESAKHLLGIAGKRLRPMCVALAARAGTGFGRSARELAVAVELVHNATLLHDDVIDLGERRRGKPTARMVWGNAASIYAGDLLLVEALERVRAAGFPELLDAAFAVLKEMLDAESLQLANRGLVGTFEDYFRVVEGKTASLFGWALLSGATAGGLSPEEARLLERFGRKLGVAFQIVDDVLDVEGAESEIGKNTFADLREGKITHPLLVAAMEPGVRAMLERAARGELDDMRELVAALARTRAARISRDKAEALVAEGISLLDRLPASGAIDALRFVALALPERSK